MAINKENLLIGFAVNGQHTKLLERGYIKCKSTVKGGKKYYYFSRAENKWIVWNRIKEEWEAQNN